MESEELKLDNTQNLQIGIPQCKQQSKSNQVCQNPNCNNFIFLCNDQECECQKQHQFCIKVALKPLVKIISKKRQTTNNNLGIYIQKITDDLIDQISKIRDDILNRIQYLGLNQQQRTFLSLMEKKEYSKISALDIHEICSTAHIKQSICLQNSIQFVQYCWQKEKKKFDQIIQNLPKIVIKSFNRPIVLKNFDSKIITVDNSKDLVQMFNQKVIGMNLIYRGSQHNFSITQFRSLCDKKKNTLCIVTTQAGNIIGAYTPIPWDTNNNSQYVNDPTLNTFIFSLTMKKKFVQTNGGNQSTHHYTNWGPRFGTDGSCDFGIGQNANNGSSNCYANIGNIFLPSDPQDMKNLQTIKQNFVGGGIKGTSKFKITQWEMFQVNFA